MAVILNSAILDSAILVLSSQTHSHMPRLVPNICTKKLHLFILTQLDDCSYLDICHPQFSHFAQKNFTHAFWLNLMMAAILNSAILDSAILHNKTSLIHSHSTWWWQPSWILPSWIQTLTSWIETPCNLLSDSLKNTLPPLWLGLTLIPSD